MSRSDIHSIYEYMYLKHIINIYNSRLKGFDRVELSEEHTPRLKPHLARYDSKLSNDN